MIQGQLHIFCVKNLFFLRNLITYYCSIIIESSFLLDEAERIHE